MEDKSRKRDLSVQRRAAQAVSAAAAASCADDLMESLLDESRSNRTGKGTGGGLLEGLGPIGPPISYSPEMSNVLEANPRMSENLEVEKGQVGNLGVKRVAVTESQPARTPNRESDSRRTQTEPMSRSSKDGAPRENIGNGKGSGPEPVRVDPQLMVEKGKCEVSLDPNGGACERYYIGEGPPGLESVRGIAMDPSEVMNPWSREKWRTRGTDGYLGRSEVGIGGPLFGSSSSTPQKGYVDPTVRVEMDPIELFRLRCIREAEEKFRMGLQQMESGNQEGQGWSVGGEKGSQSSFQSACEPPEPFVPKPPPGPPPPSPPKMPPSGCDLGMANSPVPPFPSLTSGVTNLSGSSGENPTESLRSVDLPVLQSSATALQYGDWLSIIDSQMGDLSYTSSEWWSMIREGVNECYQKWLNASPLEKLRMTPQVNPRTKLWPRTERRALSMLLASIPESIRDELVSARKLSTDQVLYKLSITFQPGGAAERTKLLQSITDTKCGSSLTEILDWIRLWRRYVQRAREINVTLPDGLVLLGSLSKCIDLLSAKSPQGSYRLNLVRQQLSVDQLPTMDAIQCYSEHLQAEAEDLMLSSQTKGPSAVRAAAMGVSENYGNVGNPPIEPEGKPPVAKKGACRYWMSEKGCTRGDQCKFGHAKLEPQSERCFNCSALGHSKRDCPHKNPQKGSKGEGSKG